MPPGPVDGGPEVARGKFCARPWWRRRLSHEWRLERWQWRSVLDRAYTARPRHFVNAFRWKSRRARAASSLMRESWRRQAAPAMYRASRPHARHRSVTWQRGGGGKSSGVRSIWPEQDGQLSGAPVRSLAIRWRACAGLNVAGLGLRICATSRLQVHPGWRTAPVRLVTIA